MKLLRIQNFLWLSNLVAPGSCITLLGVIQSNSELSTLKTYINASSSIASLFGSANNFTFLAPSNAAIQSFISRNPNILTKDLIEATLQYSLLRGGFPTLSFSNTSQFISSNLVNATYANVTGGQAVELVLGANGTPQVVTGNRSISTSTSADIVCTGGLIHIVNDFLSIPVPAVLEITEAQLQYFVAILNTGGYLNVANTYVDKVLQLPDVTYFIPNSAVALADTTALARNSTAAELQAIFEYHVVPGYVGYGPLLQNGMVLKTQQGASVTVTIQNGDTYVNAAKIISSNYLVANGVVHVIDTLLNRFDTSPPPRQSSSSTVTTSTPTSSPTLSTSVSTATPTTSGSATPTAAEPASSDTHISGSTIGLAVGVSVAGLLVIGAIAWFLFRRRRQKNESRVWEDQSMSGAPSVLRDSYIKGDHSQRQGDSVSGIQSIGIPIEIPYSREYTPYDSKPARPTIPPRSPSRVIQGDEF